VKTEAYWLCFVDFGGGKKKGTLLMACLENDLANLLRLHKLHFLHTSGIERMIALSEFCIRSVHPLGRKSSISL
jgi:hypothetical protein